MIHYHLFGEDASAAGPLQFPMLEVEFAQLSDPGRMREGNEDYLGCATPDSPEAAHAIGWLFALADGVGGHDKGEVASRIAVDCILAGFRGSRAGEPHADLMSRLIQQANARVMEAGRAAGVGGNPMATTLVSCALRHDRAVVAHVGDSRCYLIRRGQPVALTRDHTVAGEQVRMGLLSVEDAAGASTRHVLSRSLGSGAAVNVEINEHQVVAEDILVLCSDGLHGAVDAAEMAAMVAHQANLKAAARQLVALANQQDGSDNISVQLIRVRSVERVGMYRGRPYRLR